MWKIWMKVSSEYKLMTHTYEAVLASEATDSWCVVGGTRASQVSDQAGMLCIIAHRTFYIKLE